MGKVDDLRRDDLEAQFQTGMRPPQNAYWDIFRAIQEAAQEHEHRPGGGPGTGTGDAGPVGFLSAGEDAAKATEPQPGQAYVATDSARLYVCFAPGQWTVAFEAG